MNDSGQSLGDILGCALREQQAKKPSSLTARAAAQGLVLNGCGSRPSTVETVETRKFMRVRFEFVSPAPGTLDRIQAIKAVRHADNTLSLVEAKNFVEGETLYGIFQDYDYLNDYIKRMNDHLPSGRITVSAIQEHLVRV